MNENSPTKRPDFGTDSEMKGSGVSIRQAYDIAATEYRKKYEQIPARREDVEIAFSFYTKDYQPKVLEIGCAYGREAKYILTKTPHYIGVDFCQQYIDEAKVEVLGGTFLCEDVLHYKFPADIDIIFAFASLLHIDKDEMGLFFKKAYESLSQDGIVFISLKRRDHYFDEVVVDELVERRFYYYNRATIEEITDKQFRCVLYQEQELKEGWFTMVLQKIT
jgi:SAM-dependent methyltransferase